MPAGTTIVVAASGGADSTALLFGLAGIAHEHALTLVAAHLHHGLRGADADADREAVMAQCERLGLPLISARWDTRARMRRRGWSGQDGLRRLRREFLRGVARRLRAGAIATGHTADDQVETLLLRLVRGSGLRGLGGIRPRSRPWIRPLLEASRADIEADLRGSRIPWREDASNEDRSYRRNRARHEVVPALRALAGATSAGAGGRFAVRVARTLAEVRSAERLVAARASRWLDRHGWTAPGTIPDRSRLARQPLALRRGVLRQIWLSTHPKVGLTREHLEALDRLLRTARRGRIALPGGVEGRVAGPVLRIGSPATGIETRRSNIFSGASTGKVR